MHILPTGDRWKPLVDRIDRHLENFLPRILEDTDLNRYAGPPRWTHDPVVHTEMLSTPTWDLISRGGKRWRPLFGILLLESLGNSADPYEEMVVATAELCHTGALIIDDIEDGSVIRRGEQAIHLRYGTDVAINAANTLYFLPHLLYSDHPDLSDSQRLETYRSMVQQLVKAHLGQAMDIYWSRNLTAENFERWLADGLPEKILQMYAYKTGSALEGLAELACTVGSTDERLRQACVGLGRDLGVAFQIADDVLDFQGSPSWRKKVGQDVATGKLTYAVVRALDRLGSVPRRHLLDLLCRRSSDQDTVSEAISLVHETGALEECRGQARRIFEKAWSSFTGLVPESGKKAMLRELCDALIGAWMPSEG